MEIIKPGVIIVQKYYGLCSNCDCEFKVDDGERMWEPDYDGSDPYYPCPTCGKKVYNLRKILPDGRVLP
jgi:DNA-directed RNA polymerase subunit RPC12/RpoP